MKNKKIKIIIGVISLILIIGVLTVIALNNSESAVVATDGSESTDAEVGAKVKAEEDAKALVDAQVKADADAKAQAEAKAVADAQAVATAQAQETAQPSNQGGTPSKSTGGTKPSGGGGGSQPSNSGGGTANTALEQAPVTPTPQPSAPVVTWYGDIFLDSSLCSSKTITVAEYTSYKSQGRIGTTTQVQIDIEGTRHNETVEYLLW